jgi:LysR family transcriptional activator of nhaA
MINHLNFKHLYYFWVVAEEGSIVSASKRLSITPQTISGQISLLEDRVNNALFRKSGRNLQLTDTGQIVKRYADGIFSLGQELSDVLRGITAAGHTELIVAAASALPKATIYKILQPALTLEQEFALTLTEGPVESILADLAVNKVDLVLSDTQFQSNIRIKAFNHFLGSCGLSVLAAKGLAKKYTKSFPQSLHEAPLLLPTRQYAIRKRFDRWLENMAIRTNIRGQFDDSAVMKAFGQAGFGLFFVPDVVEEEVCRMHAVTPVGHIPEVKHDFYAISAERRVTHPAVAAICDQARKMLIA